MDNNRKGTQGNTDMTQRVPAQNPTRPAKTQNKPNKGWSLTAKEKGILIALGSLIILLLLVASLILGGLLAGLFEEFNTTQDDGKIVKGVIAAGVDLSGMTKGEAKYALEKATADTYTKLDMVVEVLGTQIHLSPSNTGARLNIDAVVDEAYNYGRTGSRSEQEQAREYAQNNSVNISIVKHLNLNTGYIQSEISKLGNKFGTALNQPNVTLSGTKPGQLNLTNPDTSVTYQTLTLYVGTPEYGLDTQKLYNQVLEYYNMHMFKVEGDCTAKYPDSYEEELKQIFDQLYVAPVDARKESDWNIAPEKYGYGFNLEEFGYGHTWSDLKEMLPKTPDGSTFTIRIGYLRPNVTREDISNQTFKDILGEDSSPLGEDAAWNTNVELACKALNGTIVSPGSIFSFNALLGDLAAEGKGYVVAKTYLDRVIAPVLGGGVTHVASLLYTSVLEAEMEITERHGHPYVTTFVSLGRDAYVDDHKDFRFTNNLEYPILIHAEVKDNTVAISIEGVEYRAYDAEIVVEEKEIIEPGILHNIMLPESGYVDGEMLDAGLNGSKVWVYLAQINKETGEEDNRSYITDYSYEAKDKILVHIPPQSAA